MDLDQHHDVQTQPQAWGHSNLRLGQTAAPQAILSSKAWHPIKIACYCFSIIFCIIVLGISIALVVDPAIYQGYQIIWIAPQAAVALCWDAAELITIFARRRGRGIHPGAHVALHLLLWLGFGAAVGLTAWLVAFAAECDYYCRYYGTGDGFKPNRYASILDAELAVLAFLTITHFVLFVRACVETNQRRKLEEPVSVVLQKVGDNRQFVQYPAQPISPAQR